MEMPAEAAKKLNAEIAAWRRALHAVPETGLNLPRTREYILSVLDETGLDYRLHHGSSGIEVLIEGTRPGAMAEAVALRADMDALPIAEKTGLSFASANGCMHACGHDAHAAMLLGAARLLAERRERFSGRVKCIFQPGEEGHGGAERMIAEGALENPHVGAVIGIHVTNVLRELAPGAIGLKKGALMASSDAFAVKALGKGGHVANPDHVVNPVYIAAEIVTALRRLFEEFRVPPKKAKTLLSVGTISGGRAGNAVPDDVVIQGSVRSLDADERREILSRMERVAAETALRMGGACEVEIADSCGIVRNDDELTDLVAAAAEKLFPDEKTAEIVTDIMASEDISRFFEARKGVYIHLGCGFEDGREVFPLHNAKFDLNEDVLWKGAALLARSAMDVLDRATLPNRGGPRPDTR